MINPLPDDKNFALFKFKVIADDKFNLAQMMKIFSDKVENIEEKEKKCWLPSFFHVSKNVFKRLFSGSFEGF